MTMSYLLSLFQLYRINVRCNFLLEKVKQNFGHDIIVFRSRKLLPVEVYILFSVHARIYIYLIVNAIIVFF